MENICCFENIRALMLGKWINFYRYAFYVLGPMAIVIRHSLVCIYP